MAIVGKSSEVPPDEIKAFDVDGVRIAIAQSDGEFHAFDDMCTHEECSLEEDGEIDGTEITCLCHFSVFDIHTGKVIEGPATEPLPIYGVSVIDDDIDVTI
ncbi:MAG: Rieske (2Fe-2S) protein [Acidimicrobiia bacterium]